MAACPNLPKLAILKTIAMYKTILVPVENRETDQTILQHIRPLARLTHAKLMLVHVADGWVARNYEQLKLQESEEMKQDREYLANLRSEERRVGKSVDSGWGRVGGGVES